MNDAREFFINVIAEGVGQVRPPDVPLSEIIARIDAMPDGQLKSDMRFLLGENGQAPEPQKIQEIKARAETLHPKSREKADIYLLCQRWE